ncbi:5-oxoprolinase subunit B family protein [Mycolicibacterium sediminis]|uniref:5-oxoprolinase subunit B family protein n=1 Tax=Mycolicibacterium sediminis TaxID=1286180 RepID=UPI0013D201EC|nr:carboxyltransferase domain-containing protein [Mycolicibacterium sediminis]
MTAPDRRDGPAPAHPATDRFRVRPVGSGAILVEVDPPDAVRSLASWVNGHRLRRSLREVIPAAETLFLSGEPSILRAIGSELLALGTIEPSPERAGGRRVTVDVRYDGADLREVAGRLGLSPDDVVDMHSSADHVVEFFGFAPGQAFFGRLPESLQLPRRATPRTLVPSGALAIANGFTVIYPDHSPGGWNLIGTRLSEPLWDIRKTPPNQLEVGDVVRFRPCR